MNTRRYFRTMQEAWGPYTDHVLYPMPDPPRPSLLVVLVARLFGWHI